MEWLELYIQGGGAGGRGGKVGSEDLEEFKDNSFGHSGHLHKIVFDVWSIQIIELSNYPHFCWMM